MKEVYYNKEEDKAAITSENAKEGNKTQEKVNKTEKEVRSEIKKSSVEKVGGKDRGPST